MPPSSPDYFLPMRPGLDWFQSNCRAVSVSISALQQRLETPLASWLDAISCRYRGKDIASLCVRLYFDIMVTMNSIVIPAAQCPNTKKPAAGLNNSLFLHGCTNTCAAEYCGEGKHQGDQFFRESCAPDFGMGWRFSISSEFYASDFDDKPFRCSRQEHGSSSCRTTMLSAATGTWSMKGRDERDHGGTHFMNYIVACMLWLTQLWLWLMFAGRTGGFCYVSGSKRTALPDFFDEDLCCMPCLNNCAFVLIPSRTMLQKISTYVASCARCSVRKVLSGTRTVLWLQCSTWTPAVHTFLGQFKNQRLIE